MYEMELELSPFKLKIKFWLLPQIIEWGEQSEEIVFKPHLKSEPIDAEGLNLNKYYPMQLVSVL